VQVYTLDIFALHSLYLTFFQRSSLEPWSKFDRWSDGGSELNWD